MHAHSWECKLSQIEGRKCYRSKKERKERKKEREKKNERKRKKVRKRKVTSSWVRLDK